MMLQLSNRQCLVRLVHVVSCPVRPMHPLRLQQASDLITLMRSIWSSSTQASQITHPARKRLLLPPVHPGRKSGRAKLASSGMREAKLVTIFGSSHSFDESSSHSVKGSDGEDAPKRYLKRRNSTDRVASGASTHVGTSQESVDRKFLRHAPHVESPWCHLPRSLIGGRVCPPIRIQSHYLILAKSILPIPARNLFVLRKGSSPMPSLSIGGTKATVAITVVPWSNRKC